MKWSKRFFFLMLLCKNVHAGHESMSSMPILHSTKSFTVQGNENLEEQRGFGAQESTVRMNHLMMVEGSGYEGMEMPAGEQPKSWVSPASSLEKNGFPYTVQPMEQGKTFQVGVNTLDFLFTSKTDHQRIKGLKLKAEVFMTSMNMGTESAPVKEVLAGVYRVSASFSMQGSWAVKLIFKDKEKIFNFVVKKSTH